MVWGLVLSLFCKKNPNKPKPRTKTSSKINFKIILCLNCLGSGNAPAQEHIWRAGRMHSGFKADEHSWKDSVVTNTAWESKSRTASLFLPAPVLVMFPVWLVQSRNSYQREIRTLRIIFITMACHPEKILQFVSVWLIGHITISGSSRISQIQAPQRILQLRTHSFALLGNSFQNAPGW